MNKPLIEELDEYLKGCPDPDRVIAPGLINKASRLLWRCRVVLKSMEEKRDYSHCCIRCSHCYTPAFGESEDCPVCGCDGT